MWFKIKKFNYYFERFLLEIQQVLLLLFLNFRPRKRRQDQIPINWVPPTQSVARDNEISTYNNSFQKYDSNCKLPPIRQKDELSGQRENALFERYSLYR